MGPIVMGFFALLVAAGAPAKCKPAHGRVAEEIRGEVRADSTFQRATPHGRFIVSLTPPWHFVPNPREIEGWHFRNAANTGPNDGSVNAPRTVRGFIFSPEVGRTIEYNGSNTTEEEVARVEAFGQGTLTILDYDLSPPAPGERARFERLKFVVCLSWPKKPR